MNRRISLSLLVAVTIAGGTQTAHGLPSQPRPIDGFSQFIAAQSLIYSDSLDSQRIDALIEEAASRFSRARAGDLSAYWLARAHLLSALRFNRQGLRRQAQRQTEQVFTEIERAMRRGEFSDGLRVYADAHFQTAQARGFVYMVRNGDDAVRATLRALELGPENIHAHITGAGYYLNAPPFAGGDVNRAVVLLERARTLTPESENDLFVVHSWLTKAYARTNRPERAADEWQLAYAIYPQSTMLREIAEENDITVSR